MSSVEVLVAMQRAGTGHGVELRQHLLLERHALEHGLDDHVGAIESGLTHLRRDPADALGRRFRGEAALFHRAVVVLADRRHRAVEAGLFGVGEHHGDAGVGARHGDAAAHRAGADDRDRRDRRHRDVLADAGHLGHGAFGEERVNHRPRLPGLDQLVEQLALAAAPLVEGQCGRGRHGGDRRGRRVLVPAHLLRELVRRRHHRGQLRCRGELVAALARPGMRPARGRDLGGKRDGARHEVVDDAVDEAGLQRLGRLDRPARHDHRERGVHADEPRQPLRAFGARDDAEVHLRQAELRAGDGHAVVRGHGHFDSAAERSPVDRHHDRLRALLDALQQVVHLGRAGVAAPDHVFEALDVRAGDERAAGRRDHDGLGRGVGFGLRQRGREAVDGLGAEGVDRGVVDEDDGHRAVEAE